MNLMITLRANRLTWSEQNVNVPTVSWSPAMLGYVIQMALAVYSPHRYVQGSRALGLTKPLGEVCCFYLAVIRCTAFPDERSYKEMYSLVVQDIFKQQNLLLNWNTKALTLVCDFQQYMDEISFIHADIVPCMWTEIVEFHPQMC